MKKKRNLAYALLMLSLIFPLSGCTSLDYLDNDVQIEKISRIQTKEEFNLQVVEKSIGNVNIKAGVSETVLDSALVLYISVQNNSSESFKFAIDDINVTSPIGEVTKIPPSMYIDGFYTHEAANYIGLANAGASLGNFATFQNAKYERTYASTRNNVETASVASEMDDIESTIKGIQKHTVSSYKFIEPNSSEYFYVFLRKPDEYPIVVKYKTLTYKFGGKKNVQAQN